MPADHRPLLARAYVCLIGMLIGQLFWFVLYDLARVGNIFAWFAYPIMILGWLLVWGDNGPPPWAESDRLHVVFGLCFYGAIGALIGLWAKRR